MNNYLIHMYLLSHNMKIPQLFETDMVTTLLCASLYRMDNENQNVPLHKCREKCKRLIFRKLQY